MSLQFNENLNAISGSDNLEIQLLDGDLNIIAKLDDEPNDVGGLTSAELKAKFDEAGNTIQKYINETLIPAVVADDATEAARAAAEQGRVTAEETRQTNETARQQGYTAMNKTVAKVGTDMAQFKVWETYSASKSYVPLNKVTYNGSSYICISAVEGVAPPNETYWQLIAAKGTDGEGTGDMLQADYDADGAVKDAGGIKAYADTKLPKSGGTMTGNLDMGGKKLQNLPTPEADTDAAPKSYVDNGLKDRSKAVRGTYPAAAGQSIAVGDVVDVVNGEVIIKKAVNTVIPTWILDNTVDINNISQPVQLTVSRQVFTAYNSSGSYIYLVDSDTFRVLDMYTFSTSFQTTFSIAKLTDSSFAASAYPSAISMFSITNDKITLSSTTTLNSLSSSDWVTFLLPLDSTHLAMDTTSSYETVYVVELGTSTPISSLKLDTSSSHHYATLAAKLMETDAGDRYIVMCEARGSRNVYVCVVKVSPSFVLSLAGIVGNGGGLDIDYVDAGAYIVNDRVYLFRNSGTYVSAGFQVVSISDSGVPTPLSLQSISDTSLPTQNISLFVTDDNYLFLFGYRSGSYLCCVYSYDLIANQFTKLSSITVPSTPSYPLPCDGGCYMYGSDNKKGVRMRVVQYNGDLGGTIVYDSSQGIALTSASAGQNCDVLFEGVAESPGLIAGTNITSDGVQGYVPQDGVLSAFPWWDYQRVATVTGSYTGDGAETQSIYLGFPPRAVLTARDNGYVSYKENGKSVVYGGLAMPGKPVTTEGSIALEVTETGFAVHEISGNNYVSTNQSGTVYYYIAFR